MRNQTRIFIVGPVEPGQPVVDRDEVTELGGGGMGERLTLRIRYAACGHMTRTADEIGGVCGCGDPTHTLCHDCAADRGNLCGICRRLTAGPCQRWLWLAPGLGMVCRSCARRWRAREALVVAIVSAIVVAVIAMVIRMIT
ncbi:MAG: hypothetical protein FJ280_25190 [Planctomycetes bacterium]|nr:hypothetical protein [Planctomycetota bacterium]